MGLRMTDEAAARIEDRFDNLSQDFWQLMEMVPDLRSDIARPVPASSPPR